MSPLIGSRRVLISSWEPAFFFFELEGLHKNAIFNLGVLPPPWGLMIMTQPQPAGFFGSPPFSFVDFFGRFFRITLVHLFYFISNLLTRVG